ncbi:hypothetical protein N869_07100 [Cellulomonas bogoriensis 69B4 = DSM 16987]|uniref:DUF5063 domain-containing protein n=1 Tax=Cellulomonas bogoriensis 69B4 = DSM 16987 TaxID=1386082 RepID=A0A0A0BQQ4_9CELL|nr:hypothetical protein N869_07100 [Cellulomonas bogoriensis 69B4 = DSM 16987]
MPDTPDTPDTADTAARGADEPEVPTQHDAPHPTAAPADLREVADTVADETRAFMTTVTEVAAGTNPDAAIPLLLLAVSDVLAAGARLGAMVDVVPPERFEPDTGPDADLDPLRAALGNVLEGIDDYTEVDDPVLGADVVTSSLSSDLVLMVGALDQGWRHYEAGRVLEALWWWQFSYLSNWGERASAVLRVLQTVLAHVRLDVDDEVAADAEFQALHP